VRGFVVLKVWDDLKPFISKTQEHLMAFTGSCRLAFTVAATLATIVVSSSAYAGTDHTAGPYAGPTYTIVIGHADNHHAFDIAPLAMFKEQPARVTQRGYHVTKPIAIKTRVAAAAVLATTQAGWRSGRLRKLSG
jgi:hypothetical protein